MFIVFRLHPPLRLSDTVQIKSWFRVRSSLQVTGSVLGDFELSMNGHDRLDQMVLCSGNRAYRLFFKSISLQCWQHSQTAEKTVEYI